MRRLICLAAAVLVALTSLRLPAATVKIAPAPAGEELSKAFTVTVEGKECPVYAAKVAPRDPAKRWLAIPCSRT